MQNHMIRFVYCSAWSGDAAAAAVVNESSGVRVYRGGWVATIVVKLLYNGR